MPNKSIRNLSPLFTYSCKYYSWLKPDPAKALCKVTGSAIFHLVKCIKTKKPTMLQQTIIIIIKNIIINIIILINSAKEARADYQLCCLM